MLNLDKRFTVIGDIMKNKKGFTLTEVMVVVIVIASLAAIAYPMYSKVIMKARITEAISLIELVRSAQQRNLLKNGEYFSGFTNKHITGDTKIIRAQEVYVADGKLTKDLYTVNISNPKSGTPYSPKSCIVVTYGKPDKLLFRVHGLVEDNKLWCTELGPDNLGICSLITDRQTVPVACND